MNKNLLIGLMGVVAVIGGIVLLQPKKSENNNSACKDVCQKASQTCPSLINEGDCNNKCAKLSEEAKKHLAESKSCQDISAKPELLADLLIPEVATPKPADKNASECEAACGSYAGKCLTLVPNATEAIYKDGMDSCMKECASWNAQKVDCMINAFDCESMTNVCGL